MAGESISGRESGSKGSGWGECLPGVESGSTTESIPRSESGSKGSGWGAHLPRGESDSKGKSIPRGGSGFKGIEIRKGLRFDSNEGIEIDGS